MKRLQLYPRFTLTFYVLAIVSLVGIWGPGEALAAGPEPDSGPVVLKLDPPNWWAGHSINPVRVLIRGRNLTGAHVEAGDPALQIGLARVNTAGTYLFADVLIDPGAAAGPHPLKIITEKGTATAPFELLAPLGREGRFQGFSPDDIIYLLMPDRFANGDPSNDDPVVSRGLFDRKKGRHYHGGDLQGVIDHLPYLKDLGVTALWLNPIYDNANRPDTRETYDEGSTTGFHGYGAVDFYAVDEHLGDVAKFRELVEEAHKVGIKIIQDQVANHTGPYHPWVKDSPAPTWYHGTETDHLANTWQKWTLLDPHGTPEMAKATLEGWFIGILPDLNQEDEEVARYIIQNTLWWIGATGLDGIRQDTLPYVHRRFWRDWMAAIKREHTSFTVVGEMWDADASRVAFYQGGQAQFDGIDSGIDTLLDFPLYFAIRQAFAKGESIRDLAISLSHDYLYPSPDILVTFLGNHDVIRFMTEPGATIEGLKLAYTFLLTARGIPHIYYGDEIAMQGAKDPDNRREFPGGWPGHPRNAFEKSGRTPEEQSVFEHVRRLTHLRAQLEPLRRGAMVNLAVTGQTYAYARVTDHDSVIVVLNNGKEPATVAFKALPDRAILEDRLGVAHDVRVEDGALKIALPARTGAIYTVKNREGDY